MPNRDRPDSESGITLVEVLISSVLTVLLLTMAYGILNTTTKTATAITNRANNSTEARLAIDALESNLRFAKGVWLCAPLTASPGTGSSATTSCPAYLSGTPGLLVSTDGTTACSEWIITAGKLFQVSLGTVNGSSFAYTPQTNVPGVQAATYSGSATPGFTLSLPGTTTTTPPVAIAGRLVGIDLSVNEDPTPSYTAADTVTVHDAIAPNNLMTADDTTSTPCS